MTHNTKIYPLTGINNTDSAQLSQLALAPGRQLHGYTILMTKMLTNDN